MRKLATAALSFSAAVFLANYVFPGGWLVPAALLFAAGHLPPTMQMFGEITSMIMLRCFLLNGDGGLVFGYLYREYGIQYSMMAHAGAHIVWKIIWIILL